MFKNLFYIGYKLKSIVLFLWCISCFVVAKAQDNAYKATLNLYHLSMQKDGKLTGFIRSNEQIRICNADSFNGDWHLKKIFTETSENYDRKDVRDFTLFNADTFLLSGYMYDSLGGDSYILRTVNGGTSFQKIYQKGTKSNHYIDATFCNSNGEAWLSLPELGITFSQDYGLSWQIVGKLPQTRLRANSIFFKNRDTGIISTGWGGLFLTHDNCQTFKTLKTPFDEKKVIKVYGDDEPLSVDETFMFNDWLLVHISGRWFYSKQDKIEWQRFENIDNIFFDGESNTLWGVNREQHIVKYDIQCKPIWQSVEKIEMTPLSMQYKNGILYVFCSELMYCIKQKDVSQSFYYQANTSIFVDSVSQTKTANITWGWDGKSIYHSKDLGKTWYRIKRIPEGFTYFKALNDSVAIFNYSQMNRWMYNHSSGQLQPFKLTHLFDDLLSSKIVKFSISEGSTGCFHHWSNIIDYTFDKGKKKFIGKYFKGEYPEEKLGADVRNYNNSCSITRIDSFLHILNQEPEKALIFKELSMQKSDKDDYLKEVDYFSSKKNRSLPNYQFTDLGFKNVDTAFLKSIVNRSDFDSTLMKKAFISNGEWYSTTRNWVSFSIENEKGERLTLSNMKYEKSPYYIGWTGEYKDWTFTSADIGIYKFLSSLSPSAFWQEVPNEKWAIYFGLAKYLYRQKLVNE